MSPLTHRFGRVRSLMTRTWRHGSLRAALLVSGVALLAFSSVFLLQAQWGGDSSPTAAANLGDSSGQSTGTADEELQQSRPATLVDEQGAKLGSGASLARFGLKALSAGGAKLVIALYALPPTATATATPVETSTPLPPPPPTPVPQEPTAAPLQVSAPEEAPVAPPAALAEPTPTSSPPPPPPAPSCPTATMSAFAQALFDAINVERTQRALPALVLNACVVYVARLRSDDMASLNYFSHTSPSGETAFSLLDQYDVPHGWAGENLARNNYPDDESVDVAIRALMESDGHRANILSANYTQMGVGAAADGAGMKYFTMIFIGPP